MFSIKAIGLNQEPIRIRSEIRCLLQEGARDKSHKCTYVNNKGFTFNVQFSGDKIESISKLKGSF